MKILTITHNYPRWDGDRAGAFVAQLAAGIVAAGHQMRVVAPHAKGAALRETQRGVEIVRARYGPDALERVGYTGALASPMRATLLAPLMLPLFVARLRAIARRELRDYRPDIVHAHWWIPAGWIASAFRAPYMITCHGTDVRMLEKPFWRNIAAPVFARAAAVTSVSQFLAGDIATLLPGAAREVCVTPMPIDIERFEAGRSAIKLSPPQILFAGNLIASKGVDVLIEALALLRSRQISCTLKIIGQGPEESRLRALAAQRGVSDILRWSGFVSQNEIPVEYGQSTITVLPSRGQAEGLGLVLAEALLAGSAVVGSAAGGIPEVVQHEVTGLVARDGDAQHLATQLERLLGDRALRERTIADGAARVRATHAPAAAAARMIAVYTDAIGAER